MSWSQRLRLQPRQIRKREDLSLAFNNWLWTAEEKQAIDRRTQLAIVGGRDTVNRAVQALIEQTRADELLFLSDTYSDEDRLLSYSILAETMTSLNGQS